MKLISCTSAQFEVLRYIHPEQRVSSHLALVPASEYFFWTRRFAHLLDALSAYIYPTSMRAAKLPIIQCVAKFVGLSTEGFLIPRVFKFGTLPEGTCKDFGLSAQVVPLLDTVAGTLPYSIMKFPAKDFGRTGCLGFLGWDCLQPPSPGEKYLANFIPCATSNRIKDIKIINEKIVYEGKEYTSFLPTNKYYVNNTLQQLLRDLNDQKLLALPLTFPLDNLQNLIGFTNSSWAEVKPLSFFLDEDPEKLDNYVLIRTDDGKIITWNDVVNTPKLRLEIEMSDYWLWQEACHTNEALESINLYWEFGMDYPWLIDKRDNTFVPVFIVED